MGDFEEHERKRQERVKEETRIDFNNELAGRNVGRIRRFGFESNAEIFDRKQKQTDKLNLLLLTQVSRAIETAMQTASDNRDRLYARMSDVENDLSLATAEHDSFLAAATTLPDGTRVFRDKNGDVWREDGSILDASLISELHISPNAPSWEEYQASQDKLHRTKSELDRLIQLNTRNEEIVEELEDIGARDEPSLERVQELQEELEEISGKIDPEVNKDAEFKVATDKPVIAPDLSF